MSEGFATRAGAQRGAGMSWRAAAALLVGGLVACTTIYLCAPTPACPAAVGDNTYQYQTFQKSIGGWVGGSVAVLGAWAAEEGAVGWRAACVHGGCTGVSMAVVPVVRVCLRRLYGCVGDAAMTHPRNTMQESAVLPASFCTSLHLDASRNTSWFSLPRGRSRVRGDQPIAALAASAPLCICCLTYSPAAPLPRPPPQGSSS